MVLGALVDLGLEPEWLRELVASLEPEAGVLVERVMRSGIACGRVRFELPEQPPSRGLSEVLEVVDRSPTPSGVREKAGAVFRRIAEAEAAIHGVEVDEVHFHEVGALDSILDVVGGLAGAWELGYRRFFTRPIAVGTGTLRIEHGEYPLPAPATARLLEGLPVRNTQHREECTTPTGAALIAELTGGSRAPAQLIWRRCGYGAGTRDPEGRPNCLRLIEIDDEQPDEAALVTVVADIDDMAPEYVATARDVVLAAGAVDCTLVRVEMKKGRPGVRLEALVPESRLDAVCSAVFRGTTTIGLRYWPVERATLAREEELVEWRGCRIRVKRVRLPDGEERRKPELDDVVAAARKTGLTPHEVRTELDAMERSRSDSVKERGHNA
jgi:hypothetical protein